MDTATTAAVTAAMATFMITGMAAMIAVVTIAVPPGNAAAKKQYDKKCNGCLTHFSLSPPSDAVNVNEGKMTQHEVTICADLRPNRQNKPAVSRYLSDPLTSLCQKKGGDLIRLAEPEHEAFSGRPIPTNAFMSKRMTLPALQTLTLWLTY